MLSKINSIFWFRQDLRLSDNPGLLAAVADGNVLLIYIFDEQLPGKREMGAASKWWLHHSLCNLNESLDNKLNIYQGCSEQILADLVSKYNISNVYWNRCYEPWHIKRDKQIKSSLKQNNINCETFNGSLLWEPWQILKKDETYYKVFTPYYKNGCLSALPPRNPLAKPKKISAFNDSSLKVADLNLLPDIKWYTTIEDTWDVGEQAATKKLQKFLKNGIKDYKIGRDVPSKKSTSRLSPHLHFGEISPNQAWHAVKKLSMDKEVNINNVENYLTELAWREFGYYLLYHFPTLPHDNFQAKFNNFSWRNSKRLLTAWQKGLTGFPLVDAGMRELWQTGYMHNRVRMVVASFLVKNLRIHWQQGETWFWDCLLDADLANNCAGWQWVAGSGADAAPYFRIFNPTTQGEKFDANGEYTKKFVPELSKMPNKYLFKPSEAPAEILEQAGVKIGKTYPTPIIDLKQSREDALQEFKRL